MTAFRQDFNKLYNQAFSAYGQGQYEDAATMIEHLDNEYPDNPQICLLKAHIQYVSEQYQLARQNYERVMTLALGNSQEAELINCAQDGIERTGEFL
jgi:twitching motility protein PilJ